MPAGSSVIIGVAAAAIAATAAVDAPPPLLSVDVGESSRLSYSVSLRGEVWLRSSPVRAYFEHTEYPAPAQDGPARTSHGTDEIGAFAAVAQKWIAGSTSFTTTIKSYPELGVAVFETAVPGGASGTNASVPLVPGGWPGNRGNVKPIVAFPAFATDDAAVGNGTGPGLASLKLQGWESNFCYRCGFTHVYMRLHAFTV
eukprot:COSAG01_NODE_3740_length_5746_cov_2.375421_3_plen_199_part_00